jgi:hypothetical protein
MYASDTFEVCQNSPDRLAASGSQTASHHRLDMFAQCLDFVRIFSAPLVTQALPLLNGVLECSAQDGAILGMIGRLLAVVRSNTAHDVLDHVTMRLKGFGTPMGVYNCIVELLFDASFE